MKNRIKRLMALILAMTMCLSLINFNVWAAEEPLEDTSVSAQSREETAPSEDSEDLLNQETAAAGIVQQKEDASQTDEVAEIPNESAITEETPELSDEAEAVPAEAAGTPEQQSNQAVKEIEILHDKETKLDPQAGAYAYKAEAEDNNKKVILPVTITGDTVSGFEGGTCPEPYTPVSNIDIVNAFIGENRESFFVAIPSGRFIVFSFPDGINDLKDGILAIETTGSDGATSQVSALLYDNTEQILGTIRETKGTQKTAFSLDQNCISSLKAIKIKGTNNAGQFPGADIVSVYIESDTVEEDLLKPVVATDLKAEFKKYDQILLSWKPARNVNTYKVFYRLSPDDNWTLINQTNKTSFTYKHKYSGNKVSFCIVNVKADGTNGGFSDPITVSYPILQNNPGIKVNNEKKGKIKVSWLKDPVAKGYEISIATNKNTNKASKKADADTKEWIATLKSPQKKNYIRVRSYFLEGTSKIYTPWSAPSLCKLPKIDSGSTNSTSVKPKVWSLVIGGFESEEYGRTKKEVNAVSKRLSKNKLKNHTVKSPVKKVYKDNFTISQFYALVQQTFYQTGDDDISYVYYHGHGNEAGLCMYNPYVEGYETFMYEDILDMLSQHIRGTIIFIIDACHSGECVRVVKKHPSRNRFVIIAAAKKDQSARNTVGYINLITKFTQEKLHLPSSLMKIDDRSRLSIALEYTLVGTCTIKSLCNGISTIFKRISLDNALAKQNPVFYSGPSNDMVIHQ